MRLARGGAALLTAFAVLWLLQPAGPPMGDPDEISEPLAAERRIAVAIVRPQEPRERPEPPQLERAQPADSPTSAAQSPPAQSVQAKPAAAGPHDPGPSPTTALADGRAWLDSGAFPLLRATYDRIGFVAYRDAVLELGGRFFLFDSARHRPVAEIDPRNGQTRPFDTAVNLSQWPRDVTRHLRAFLATGQARFGARVSRVILLPPVAVDAALLGALSNYLRAQGVRPADLLRVDLAYELRDGRLTCEVLGLSLRGTGQREVRLRIDLAAGVRA